MGLGGDFLTLSKERVIPNGPAEIYPILSRAQANTPFGVGVTECKAGVLDLDLNYDEALYLLEGDLTIRTETEDHVLQPGQLLWMPRGRRIQYVIETACKFLYVVSPPGPNS